MDERSQATSRQNVPFLGPALGSAGVLVLLSTPIGTRRRNALQRSSCERLELFPFVRQHLAEHPSCRCALSNRRKTTAIGTDYRRILRSTSKIPPFSSEGDGRDFG